MFPKDWKGILGWGLAALVIWMLVRGSSQKGLGGAGGSWEVEKPAAIDRLNLFYPADEYAHILPISPETVPPPAER